MDKVYPIKVIVNAKDEHFPIKFAEEAASCLQESERLSIEITSEGLVLKGIWDLDLELAINELSKKFGKKLKHSDYAIEYIKGERTLEPIMIVGVITPEEYMGDIMASLNRRRGLVDSMDDIEEGKLIKARVPLSELLGYRSELQKVAPRDWIIMVDFCSYEPTQGPEEPDPNEPASQALRA